MDNETITAGRLAQLLGVTPKTVAGLAKDGIAVRGEKGGTYRLETVTRYVAHLSKHRREAAKPVSRRASD